MKMKKTNTKLILIFVFLFSTIYFTPAVYSQHGSECVICAQFVPDCGADEILVPQTCTDCAHCESIGKQEKKAEKTRESLFSKLKKKLKRNSK